MQKSKPYLAQQDTVFNHTCQNLHQQHNFQEHFQMFTFSKPKPKPPCSSSRKQSIVELPKDSLLTTEPKKHSKWKQWRLQQSCRKFIRKLKQNITLQTVYNIDSDTNKSSLFVNVFGNRQGYDPHSIWVIVLDMLSLVMRLFLGILYSLDIVFGLSDLDIFFAAEILGICVFCFEMTSNFTVKVDKDGRRINYMKDIAKEYLTGSFITDLIYLGLILADTIAVESKIVSYVRLIAAIYKLIYSLQRIDKIQKISFSSHQAEQIWGICLVLLVNFIFAHVISLILNGMAMINPNQNWWYLKGCQDDAWYVKYVYGMYWGSNIMLTVGFGDIVATNWHEALCLVFIEMISCIVLSYNISCLGGLITNLRKNNQEKNNNVRLFNRMYDQETSGREKKPTYIRDKVYQFIQGHYQTKKQFNLQDQKSVISIFPQGLKQSYMNEIYLPILKFLPILRKFSTECLQKVITKIQKTFVHPDSFIIQEGDRNRIIVLSKGEASFVFKRKLKHQTENIVVEKVVSDRKPYLISGKEVVYDEYSKHNILSTEFSIVHTISGTAFREIVRSFPRDRQIFCMLKDQSKVNDLVLNCLECKLCNECYHSKYDCPLLHFQPLKSILIQKNKFFNFKQNRFFVLRHKSEDRNVMRKSELSDVPKTDKVIPIVSSVRRETRARRATLSIDTFEEQNLEFDKIFQWNVYFPQHNMQFRREEEWESITESFR